MLNERGAANRNVDIGFGRKHTAAGETVHTRVFRSYEFRSEPYYRTNLLISEEVNRDRTGTSLKKHRVTMGYDDRGFLINRTVQAGFGDDEKSEVELGRDASNGLVLSSTVMTADLPDDRTTYEYDQDKVHLSRVENSRRHTAHIVIHPALGKPVMAVDVNGVTRRMKYDFLGRLRDSAGPGSEDFQVEFGQDDYFDSLDLGEGSGVSYALVHPNNV